MKYLFAALGSYFVSFCIATTLMHGKVQDLVEERQIRWPGAETDRYCAEVQAAARRARGWFSLVSGSLMALVVSAALWLIG